MIDNTATIGIFAIVACMLLPGLLVLQTLSLRLSIFASCAIAIGVSATVNHLLVVMLVIMGAYQRHVLFLIVLCEFLALAGLVFLFRKGPSDLVPSTSDRAIERLATAACAAVFAYVFWTFGRIAFADFGEVFMAWDAVVSWNKWASEWASGTLPVQTFEYPQLLPSLWSMIYVIVGGPELQIFPKAMIAWLPMVMFVLFADLARCSLLTGTVAAFSSLKLLLLFGSFSLSGYADFPSGILSFAAFYVAALSRQGSNGDQLAILGAVIAAGAALTKQSGAFFAICYPFFLWLISPTENRHNVWRSIVIVIAIVLPWYAYRVFAIQFWGELSNIAVTTQSIHAGRTYFERLLHGIDLIHNVLNGMLLWGLVGLLIAALWSRFGRILVLAVVLPYLLIYGLFFSYDIRNATPLIPFLGWAMGIGATNVGRLLGLSRFKPSLGPPNPLSSSLRAFYWKARGWPLALLLVALLCTSVFARMGKWPTEQQLLEDQNRRLMLLGDPVINQTVLSFIETQHPPGKILTNDYLLGAIPALKPYYLAFLMGPWTTEDTLNYVVKSQSVSAVLAIEGAAAHLKPTFDRWVSEGRIIIRAGSPESWVLLEFKQQ
jgi:hypothetical protein